MFKSVLNTPMVLLTVLRIQIDFREILWRKILLKDLFSGVQRTLHFSICLKLFVQHKEKNFATWVLKCDCN